LSYSSGEDGRLGHGDIRDRVVPRKVMSLLRDCVLSASCGGAHTAVLTASNGELLGNLSPALYHLIHFSYSQECIHLVEAKMVD